MDHPGSMDPVEAAPSSTAGWLRRWTGEPVAEDTPERLVGPMLTLHHWQHHPDLEDGVRVVVVEAQDVWPWGLDDQEGPVERANEAGATWRPTGETEAEFWLHHAAVEFVVERFVAYRGGTVTLPGRDRLVASTRPLPCGTWAWGGHQQVRYRGRALALVWRDGESTWVQVAAPAEDDLAWADGLDIEWSESDSRTS